MFDEYRIDVYLTDGPDDADQRKVLIDLVESGSREQARRSVMDSIDQFTRPASGNEQIYAYWIGYATAMFECTDPNMPLFLDARRGARELSISIRTV